MSRVNEKTWEAMVAKMDGEKFEQACIELVPCTEAEFFKGYIELDPDFEDIARDEFGVVLVGDDLTNAEDVVDVEGYGETVIERYLPTVTVDGVEYEDAALTTDRDIIWNADDGSGWHNLGCNSFDIAEDTETRKFEVIEDAGGRLALAIYDAKGEEVVYLHTGYESEESLMDDIESLNKKEIEPEDWEENCNSREFFLDLYDIDSDGKRISPQAFYNALMSTGSKIVSDNSGIYTGRK